MPLRIQIQRVGSVAVPLPAYMTEEAAGMDLCAALPEPLRLEPGARALVPCGFAIAIPRGYEGQIRARSGLALRHGLWLPNAPGTIDPDYRGEVAVILANSGGEAVEVAPAMRVAQLVVAPVARVHWEVTDQLPASGRGDGGFGHTS